MTHIRGQIEEWTATFSSYKYVNGELILNLIDGSSRTMQDWGDDTLTTLKNLMKLKAGDVIKVSTWGGRSIAEWFCDAEKI
jgi:hypothetical protein